MMVSHRVFHPICHGQCAGRCNIGLRAGAAKRAGTVIRSRRSVAPRATPWSPPASVPAARSRLWVITAQASQAQLAANSRGEVGLGGGQGRVGEERVIPPYREQAVRVVGVVV